MGKGLAFTGHRPEALPFGNDEQSPACVRLKAMLLAEIMDSAANGCDTYLAGGARGGDIIFAEQVLIAKATKYPNIRLISVVPHTDEELMPFGIAMYGTGMPCSQARKDYISTVQLLNGAIVLHLFAAIE